MTTYQLNGEINGKPSWKGFKSGSQGIWWHANGWMIGPWSKVGTEQRYMNSPFQREYDCPEKVASSDWQYYDFNAGAFKAAGANDVKIECKDKYNLFSKKH